jgi:hypothetical protein
MNERTKAWIKEVGEDCYEYSEMSQDVWFNKEKFAELIVGECVNLCYDRAYRGTLGSFTDGAMLCANDIKEHFGVEE